MQAQQEIRDQRANCGRPRVLLVFLVALLTIPVATALWDTLAFADISPVLANPPVSAEVDNPRIQMAEANLGGVDDYMHQDGDGPPSAGVPSNPYSQQAVPPPSPQGMPQQEWNNYRYADPDAARTALIGAAVVGALAVGMWALQQNELQQAQRHSRRRAYADRPAYP
jgi:hypothetical protein